MPLGRHALPKRRSRFALAGELGRDEYALSYLLLKRQTRKQSRPLRRRSSLPPPSRRPLTTSTTPLGGAVLCAALVPPWANVLSLICDLPIKNNPSSSPKSTNSTRVCPRICNGADRAPQQSPYSSDSPGCPPLWPKRLPLEHGEHVHSVAADEVSPGRRVKRCVPFLPASAGRGREQPVETPPLPEAPVARAQQPGERGLEREFPPVSPPVH